LRFGDHTSLCFWLNVSWKVLIVDLLLELPKQYDTETPSCSYHSIEKQRDKQNNTSFDKTETSLDREERGTIEGFFLIVRRVRITGILLKIWR
jgi:hypothetical protein